MTIPDKPLEINGIDPASLTLGELALFNTKSHMTPAARIDALTVFLIEHGSWSQAEVYAVTVTELRGIGVQIGDRLRGQSVPLSKKPRSKVGRGSRKTNQAT